MIDVRNVPPRPRAPCSARRAPPTARAPLLLRMPPPPPTTTSAAPPSQSLKRRAPADTPPAAVTTCVSRWPAGLLTLDGILGRGAAAGRACSGNDSRRRPWSAASSPPAGRPPSSPATAPSANDLRPTRSWRASRLPPSLIMRAGGASKRSLGGGLGPSDERLLARPGARRHRARRHVEECYVCSAARRLVR